MPRTPRPKVEKTVESAQEIHVETHAPLIFVSHHNKDCELAEAFGKLVSSVSAGVLKIFRSSDKKGSQGIEYGVEWYPKLMEKLKQASDVVCLLTENSINRPWILYEAGVAKGKLDTPVYGIALGIPLSQANSGPFAQFQNCDDNEESLTKLVMQLVERIPGSDPDHDAILMQVKLFKERVKKSLAIQKKGDKETSKPLTKESIPKLFEEIKVMFQDLSYRIERKTSVRGRNERPMSTEMLMDYGEYLIRGHGEPAGILVLFSIFRDDIPWFYDMGVEFWRAIKSRNYQKADVALHEIREMADLIMHSPYMERLQVSPRIIEIIHRNLEILIRERRRRPKIRPKIEEISSKE